MTNDTILRSLAQMNSSSLHHYCSPSFLYSCWRHTEALLQFIQAMYVHSLYSTTFRSSTLLPFSASNFFTPTLNDACYRSHCEITDNFSVGWSSAFLQRPFLLHTSPNQEYCTRQEYYTGQEYCTRQEYYTVRSITHVRSSVVNFTVDAVNRHLTVRRNLRF
jgi:hypothetical protein